MIHKLKVQIMYPVVFDINLIARMELSGQWKHNFNGSTTSIEAQLQWEHNFNGDITSMEVLEQLC